ncbi:MAG TPA: pyrroloquinoline quinone biosynthesis peptide chaperone PqqD [Candidatus Cybelea sp.]|jgi:pyrroloquinoline quinone biosynthesis protein D|nr:pyrroloquinoline quinone biosynthesis peptide chaperone PqqD [Candidatus Cybelea sp.]
MNTARPTLAKGVKLRHDRDGSVILLVPEGALVLNRTAAVALELVNGKRSIEEIAEAVVEQFEVSPRRAKTDLTELFERLKARGFIQWTS